MSPAAAIAAQWRRGRTTRWRFRRPGRSPILIFDAVGSAQLLRCLGPLDAAVLDVRWQEVNVPLLWRALWRGGRIAEAYEDEWVGAVAPKLVLTFIDNSPRFYAFASRHSGVTSMFVQNGWRGGVHDVFHTVLAVAGAPSPWRVDVMATFGSAIGREYQRYLGGRFVAVGSLLSNDDPPVSERARIRRLAYVSVFDGTHDPHAEAVALVLETLAAYARERRIPLVIVGRSADEREALYYRDVLGPGVTFRPRDPDASTYRFLDETEVTVSIDSSLGYENAARGNKHAFLSILGAYHPTREFDFGWPTPMAPDGPFWTNRPDPVAFVRILDTLFALDESGWQRQLAKVDYASLVTYDPGNSRLKQIVRDALQ